MKLIVVSILVLVCWSLSEGCQTSADCNSDQCCVTANRPKGKRQVGAGTCQPRGSLHRGCLKRNEVYDPQMMYYQCPCIDGLVCKGNGMVDIPLGEMGTCEHHA